MRTQRGFTLVEVLIALVLLGIVSTALYQLLIANQRLYRAQVQNVAINESARAAVSVVPSEIREISAGNGDIMAMTATSLTYKSMQALYIQCTAPDVVGLSIALDRNTFFGLRAISAADSVLIFAEGDPTTRGDDQWISGSVAAVTVGTACPGGRPSITATIVGLAAGQLLLVQAGAPVRTFRSAQLLLYQDAASDWWLGNRLHDKVAWQATQPLVGPLTGAGLALSYWDAAGAVTADPLAVARVGVTVQSQSGEPVYRTTGSTYLLQDLVTQVAVRNNPLY